MHDLFWSSLCLGEPVPDLPAMRTYATLCLGWYLGPERANAAVLDVDGDVAGYVLVGTMPVEHRRWATRKAVRFGADACLHLLGGHGSRTVDQFLRLRLRDGWDLRRSPTPAVVHAHMNLARHVRNRSAGPLLRDHVDGIARQVGAPSWYGEINAPVGRRETALRRSGFGVVSRAPNRTLSWFAGGPVERLTVLRELPDP